MSFLDWLERDRSDPTVPTPTADEFADAQARLDDGEELPGDEALTLAYNDRVLIPSQRKYDAMRTEPMPNTDVPHGPVAEIQYQHPEGGWIHSDLNPSDREHLHAELDEYLDKSSNGSNGFFYVGHSKDLRDEFTG